MVPQLHGQCADSCEGNCRYCVDGICTPRQHTYGYYQTNWRRWPVAPPAIPESPLTTGRMDVGNQDLELPEPADESSQDPELRHLRKRASGMPSVDLPDASSEENTFDPFTDDDNRGPTDADQPSPADGAMTAPPALPMAAPVSFATPMAQSAADNPLRFYQQSAPTTARVSYLEPVAPRRPPRMRNPLRR